MQKILVRFWLRRFLLLFILAAAGLSVAEFMQQGAEGFSVVFVAAWSLIAALFAASLATYYAYKRQCRVVYGDDNKDAG